MSLLSPGAYLRSKLVRTQYDLRSLDGNRTESLPVKHASFLISAGVVFGKLNGSGELEHLVALRSSAVIRRMLNAAMKIGKLGAEDNKTTYMDGKTYAHNLRRSAAFS